MLDFQTLYETYAAEIYRFAFWLSGSRFAAEDITSETLVRAWVRFKRVRTETLKVYLLNVYQGINDLGDLVLDRRAQHDGCSQ